MTEVGRSLDDGDVRELAQWNALSPWRAHEEGCHGFRIGSGRRRVSHRQRKPALTLQHRRGDDTPDRLHAAHHVGRVDAITGELLRAHDDLQLRQSRQLLGLEPGRALECRDGDDGLRGLGLQYRKVVAEDL